MLANFNEYSWIEKCSLRQLNESKVYDRMFLVDVATLWMYWLKWQHCKSFSPDWTDRRSMFPQHCQSWGETLHKSFLVSWKIYWREMVENIQEFYDELGKAKCFKISCLPTVSTRFVEFIYYINAFYIVVFLFLGSC